MNKLEAQRVFREWLPELELAARQSISRQSYERYAAVEAILEPEGGMCDEVEMRFNAPGDPQKALIVFRFSDGTSKEVKSTKWPASLCTACCPRYKREDAISRQAVLDILRDTWDMFSDANDAMQESIASIEALRAESEAGEE